MLKYYKTIRDVADLISDAIDESVNALIEGRVEHEPAMTDRMLGRIEGAVSGYSKNGIRWTAKTLTDRARGSQELSFGADFMGVLDISLPDFEVRKGFLAQAKLIRPNRSIDMNDLKQQCEKMLALTPDSFVFLYSKQGVRVVPAIAVIGSSKAPLLHYNWSAQRFFESHLECFIGDRAIEASTPDVLRRLALTFEARNALLIQASSSRSGSRVQGAQSSP